MPLSFGKRLIELNPDFGRGFGILIEAVFAGEETGPHERINLTEPFHPFQRQLSWRRHDDDRRLTIAIRNLKDHPRRQADSGFDYLAGLGAAASFRGRGLSAIRSPRSHRNSGSPARFAIHRDCTNK
jgi:hypothetical protein